MEKIQIKVANKEIKGVYSNVMNVQHTKEEFCLDFMNIFAPLGALTARIIVSPGHLKRMVKTLTDNLKRYEESFGEIKKAEEPEKSEIGFMAK